MTHVWTANRHCIYSNRENECTQYSTSYLGTEFEVLREELRIRAVVIMSTRYMINMVSTDFRFHYRLSLPSLKNNPCTLAAMQPFLLSTEQEIYFAGSLVLVYDMMQYDIDIDRIYIDYWSNFTVWCTYSILVEVREYSI